MVEAFGVRLRSLKFYFLYSGNPLRVLKLENDMMKSVLRICILMVACRTD